MHDELTDRPAVAIIGMAGRFPGASNLDEFWENLQNGIDSVSRFRPEEVEARDSNTGDPRYVASRSILNDVDLFDAAFFDIYPREAELMDPQHRVFLEICSEALEGAGYDTARCSQSIGVFAGCSMNTYMLANLVRDRASLDEFTGAYQVGNYTTMLGNDNAFLATRVAYKLNLRGPAITVECACSTSLVAICQAAQNLLTYSCDMALAGGVSITFPQRRGYLSQEGAMVSPDGHCRPFDQDANGTVFGHGAAVLVLKRLEDAIADRDPIRAVIRGFAVNNDGSAKVGYAAPSVVGQADVIAQAQAMAGVPADSITYIEAHGTATPLGDPIEFEGLCQAFALSTNRKQFCAIGSAKANLGHLDVASGAIGVIKTVLQMEHRRIPPLAHFRAPNPRLPLADSPFYLTAEAHEWEPKAFPLRAGVSAFGVGGTNAHVILEQAPDQPVRPESTTPSLLLWSAKTDTSLDRTIAKFDDWLGSAGRGSVADAAYTLQSGRARYKHRAFSVDPGKVEKWNHPFEDPRVAFVFPGQGCQKRGMCHGLFKSERVFRESLLECSEHFSGTNLVDLLYGESPAADALNQTRFAQGAIFAVEYALARLWMSWGIRPASLIGHSIGEFTAACIAGVMTLRDAVEIVSARGRAMQNCAAGAMLAVRASESEVRRLLPESLEIAAVNAPGSCVVSGTHEAIAAFEQTILSRRLETSHAFHSRLMEPALVPFRESFSGRTLRAPSIPILSTLTGEWLTAEQATSPDYWCAQLRHTVRFADTIAALHREHSETVFLEVGPGNTLVSQTRLTVGSKAPCVITSLHSEDTPGIHHAMGQLWLMGVEADWEKVHAGENRSRVSIPTYSFDKRRFSVEESPRQQRAVAIKEQPTVKTCTNTAANRTPRIFDDLRDLVSDLSGIDARAADAETTFLELGFDSLFLTQLAQMIGSKYKVSISFRDLINDLPTMSAVAARIDQLLPRDTSVETPAAPLPVTTMQDAPAQQDVGHLFAAQAKAMSDLFARQIEALRAPSPTSALAPAPVTEPPVAFGPYKPIQKSKMTGPDAAQAEAIAAFTRRYNAKTAGSKSVTQDHRPILADPRVAAGFRTTWKDVVYPIVSERSQGAYVWDVDGNRYVDILSGFGSIFFGHNPEFVTRALQQQIQQGYEIGPQSHLTHKVARLFQKLTGMERLTFCNTGSEAVMAALRISRTISGRDKVALFSGSYHGTIDEVLVKSAAGRSMPIAPGITRAKAQDVLVLEYGTPESLEIIRREAGNLAAVLVEPVQSRHPEKQPLEFLRELRTITQQSETALIFDEVVCGFRVHPRGAQGLFGIEADIATYGKVIGGGLPIGIVAGRKKYMDALDGGFWQFGDESVPEVGVTFFAGTFVRHPLALAAAHACLEYLDQHGPSVQGDLARRNERFVTQLQSVFDSAGVPAVLNRFMSWSCLVLSAELQFGGLLYYYLRQHGVLWMEGFPLYLTLAHTESDLNFILDAFRKSIAEMQAANLLPGRTEVEVAEPADFPITESQKEIWLSANQCSDANCAFNESITLDLKGDASECALLRALQTVVDRHESLRATISEDGERVRIQPKVDLVIDSVDLRGMGSAERGARIESTRLTHATEPFDLTKGPLVRASWLRLTNDESALIFTAHHIVCDGWSINIILEELAAIYTTELRGISPSLAAAPKFSEYAAAEAVEQQRRPETEKYWLSQFAQLPPSLEVPLDRPRPALKSFEGNTCYRSIPSDRAQHLRKTAAKAGCTLYSYLFAGFSVLLGRLSNNDEVVIGIPAAGQAAWKSSSLVGHCIHFLPVRVALGKQKGFNSIAQQCKKNLLDSYDHQNYTYGTLVRKLKLPRDPSRLPFVEVQFNVERVGRGTAFDGLQMKVGANAKAYVNFDLFLNIVDGEDGLHLQCDYNSRLLDHSTVARWLAHYETLLMAASEEQESAWERLPLLSTTEQNELAFEVNATKLDIGPELFVEVFRTTAGRFAEKVAARCEGKAITYSELDSLSDAIAFELQGRGIRRGMGVAICLDRSLEMLASLIGVWKAGAYYVPLDPGYPEERFRTILDDAGTPAVITETHYRSRFADIEATLLHPNLLARGPSVRSLSEPVSAEALAYTIYTSGSTGKPKGVAVSHGALMNFLCSMRREPGLTAEDRLLAVTTLAFDIAGLELLLPLVTGATVIIATREDAMDGDRLAALLSSEAITVMQATPATWRLLVEAGWTGSATLTALCGGEALQSNLADKLLPLVSGLWNLYGPTETTIWSSIARIRAEEPVTIGKPIANTSFYVLSPSGQLQPKGVLGELFIGGHGVAEGYHNRRELTNSKFLPDPFRNGRMFATGDVARLRADGNFEVLGREDGQIKLRGYRIEVGEIESALRTHGSIRDAAVVLREDRPGDKRLIAYLECQGEIETVGSGSTSIEHWHSVWEMLFSNVRDAGADPRDADALISGWTRMEGQASGHVRQWLEHSVNAVRALQPKRVLEIGAGTGQLCLRLAAECEEYWATDYSSEAVELLKQSVEDTPGIRGVQVFHQPAHNFAGIPQNYFDTVVINSVVQYFPDLNYLVEVINNAIRVLQPGGRILLGDLQPAALLCVMHLEQLLASAPEALTVGELNGRLTRRLSTESELSVNPSFLRSLQQTIPSVSQISFQLRRGELLNETTAYHYDAVLWIDNDRPKVNVPLWLDWHRDQLSVASLRDRLVGGEAALLGITGIPNDLLARPLGLKAITRQSSPDTTVEQIRQELCSLPVPNRVLQQLWKVADESGYVLDLRWADDGLSGLCDAVFRRQSTAGALAGSIPEFPSDTSLLQETLPHGVPSTQEIREFLGKKLPEYMIPSAFVPLAHLPRTPNGKLDRRSLPVPSYSDLSQPPSREASTPVEKELTAIWAEVLHLDKVGVDDDIFAIGGDSLLIFQIVTRANQKGVRIRPRDVFERRSIARLAEYASKVDQPEPVTRTALKAVSRDGFRRERSSLKEPNAS